MGQGLMHEAPVLCTARWDERCSASSPSHGSAPTSNITGAHTCVIPAAAPAKTEPVPWGSAAEMLQGVAGALRPPEPGAGCVP